MSNVPQQGPVKRDLWRAFRGLATWQVALAVLPLVLATVGGAVGGLLGALGMFINLKLARRDLGTVPKALAMVAVVVGVSVALLVAAAALSAAIR